MSRNHGRDDLQALGGEDRVERGKGGGGKVRAPVGRNHTTVRGFLLSTISLPKAYVESVNDWRRRGYDNSVPGEVPKIALSGDRTT